MRILIADDFKPIRTAVADILSQQAVWEVWARPATGPKLCVFAGELKPDVVVLDISMPDSPRRSGPGAQQPSEVISQ